jgi:hypothetical protein
MDATPTVDTVSITLDPGVGGTTDANAVTRSNENTNMHHNTQANNKRTKDSSNTDRPVSETQQAHLDLDNQRDLAYSRVRCLEFMQQYYVDSDQTPIFKSIIGPYNNEFEVIFESQYFNKVQAIEKQFLQVLVLYFVL